MNEFFVSEKKYRKKVAEKLLFCEAHKEKINAIYRSFLPKENTLEDTFQQWRFQILVPKKEMLLQKIFENNLFASSHYASLSSILGLKKAFLLFQIYILKSSICSMIFILAKNKP